MSVNFGQYIPGESLVHSLDARSKLFLVLALMIAVLGVHSLIAAAGLTLIMALLIALTRIPPRLYWRGIKPLLFLIVLTVVFQLFFVPGEPLVKAGPVTITRPGAVMAVWMTFRLLVIFLLAQLLTFTTSPLELTTGLEKVFAPLERVGIPAHDLAMVMSIALRFIPVLYEESDKITKAQMSRGASFGGGFMSKGRSLVAIMVPLFVRALQRADDLALAMEARCYTGGAGRTRMHETVMGARDYLVMLAGLLAALALTVKV